MIKTKRYLDENVLNAAIKRIGYVFDNFDEINVSVSSGKDSSVLYYLCLDECIKRDRKMKVFFLDQEAEYAASIEIIEKMMQNKNVIPEWFQVPIYMTNATSYSDYFLYAWGENETWMRKKNPIAIQEIKEDYPKRFYEFFDWYDEKNKNAAYMVGLRADESVTRFRAVTKKSGYNDLKWSTKGKSGAFRFYPIYDWTVYDVWKYIYDNSIPYNKIYDLMFMDNVGIYRNMRISNLIHEKAFKSLPSLPKYEPETYDKLCERISGIATASRYASEKLIFNNKKLPSHYQTWEEFRDFLLKNIPNDDHRIKFEKRFDKQEKNEKMYQHQVGQLLINDYENNRSFNTKADDNTKRLKEKWMQIL